MDREEDIAQILPARSAAIRARLADLPAPEGIASEGATTVRQTKDAEELLDILLAQLGGDSGAQASDDRLETMVLRVNRADYSIADLHGALAVLKRSIADCLGADAAPQAPCAAVLRAHQMLDGIFGACLERTALVHESVVEGSRRAYCEVDVAGHIVNANVSMHELLRKHNCRGLHLVDFFPEDAEHIERSLAGVIPPQVRRMYVRLPTGEFPVSAEFGALRLRGRVRGGYAILLDVSNFVDAEHRAFETSRFGILRVTRDGRITYANPQAAEIFGCTSAALRKARFRDFFPDPESQSKLDKETETRKRGQGSRYHLTLPPRNGRRPFPLQVDATAEYDATGEFTGSFVVLQSLHLEHAAKAIHGICESGKRAERIIADVLGVIRDFVPFDFATFAIYTPDSKFAKVASFFPPPKPPWDTLWFPVAPELRNWVLGPSPWAADLQKFLSRTPGAEEVAQSPTVMRLAREGYRAFICCPLRERDRLAAVLTLFSRQEGVYEARHHHLLRNDLGVETAVRVGYHALLREEQDFLHRLSRMVDSTVNLDDVARNLVRQLSRFYGWQNVSIFKVNRVRDRAELLAQSAGKAGGYLLPANYTQTLDKGVLGYVARFGRAVNLSNVAGGDVLARLYKPSNSATRSELCLPVRLGGEIYWLLNLEDSRLNAFAPPEVDTLKRVIGAVEAALARLFDSLTFEQIFAMSFDGVVISDAEGTIVRCNPAAEEMLEGGSAELQTLPVTDFIDDSEVKLRIATDRTICQAKAVIVGRRGQRTSVLINGGILPDEYNRKVFFLKDLGEIELQRDLRFASAAMNQLSSESRIPLALAASLVQTAGRLMQDPKRFVSTIKQAIVQIGKVELTYDRLLASVDRQRLPQLPQRRLDLSELIRRALQQLGSPTEQPSSIDVDLAPGPMLVEGDPYQLSFVIKSILAFVLRAASPDERVKLTLSQRDEGVAVSVVGPHCSAGAGTPPDPISEAEAEARGTVILAEPVLRQIVETNHRGTFMRFSPTPHTDCFELRLPRVSGSTQSSVWR